MVQMAYKKVLQATQKSSSRATEIASRAAVGGLVVVRDEPAGSVGQPGGWLVLVKRKLKIFRKRGSKILD
ncbi:hypothetical protein Tco_0297487 [Tanacetum coccineum]